jgi:hypothetical protein
MPDASIQADPTLGLALCQLAMGLDKLYRSTRSGSAGEATLAAEGLVPVDLWRGAPLELSSWSEAATAIASLTSRVESVDDPVRRAFLEDTLLSLETTVAWQAGDSLDFRNRAERLLGLRIEPIPSATLAAWRADVRSARDSESVRIVPPDKIGPLVSDLFEEAHRRAAERIGPLPDRALMRLELVHDVPYTAYCDYFANTMRLNADQPFTAERLKLLVLHEAYPGHDYHLARREHDVRLGRQPLDSLLVMTNTPSSPLFEGIGDNGALFVDWLSESERADFQLGKLRSAACVNACLMLNSDALPAAQVREFLIEEGFGHSTWAETRLRFMQDPLRAPFVFSYFLGDRCVAEASAVWTGSRSEFFDILYGQMHSPRSLRLAVELGNRRDG